MQTARTEQRRRPSLEARPGREEGVRGGDCLREYPEDAVDVVLTFRAGGEYAGLEGQRRILWRPRVLCSVRLIGLFQRLRMLGHLFMRWSCFIDPGSDGTYQVALHTVLLRAAILPTGGALRCTYGCASTVVCDVVPTGAPNGP